MRNFIKNLLTIKRGFGKMRQRKLIGTLFLKTFYPKMRKDIINGLLMEK